MDQTINDLTIELIDLLKNQKSLLNQICIQQKSIRKTIMDRDWNNLQDGLDKASKLSDSFSILEEKRERMFFVFGCTSNNIYQLSSKVPPEYRVEIITLYNNLKKDLALSKAENDAVNDYISTTRDFIKSIIDKVIPTRRNTLYTRNGKVVQKQPESMVVNAVL